MSVLDMESTITIWHIRSEQIHSEMTSVYSFHIDRKWENLQKWFNNCSETLNEISWNSKKYESLHNTMQIKLNMIGEYVENLQLCDQFLKNILSNPTRYNSEDFYHCLRLTEIIGVQMEHIIIQLNELRQLKDQLQQLMLGQNEDLNDCDAGKIVRLEDVVELISCSQVAIREKLLDLLKSDANGSSKLDLSFSCSDYEILHLNKGISVLGDVESIDLVISMEKTSAKNEESNESEMPSSSIKTTTDKYMKDLVEMFNKVMSTISDQEEFLNEKWKSGSIDNFEELGIVEESPEDFENKKLFCHSTPKSPPPKLIDVEHWFPCTKERYCQTIEEEENNMESSIVCPKINITGLTDSIENANQDLKSVISHTTENISLDKEDGRNNKTEILSTDISTSSIEGINYCRFSPESTEMNEGANANEECTNLEVHQPESFQENNNKDFIGENKRNLNISFENQTSNGSKDLNEIYSEKYSNTSVVFDNDINLDGIKETDIMSNLKDNSDEICDQNENMESVINTELDFPRYSSLYHSETMQSGIKLEDQIEKEIPKELDNDNVPDVEIEEKTDPNYGKVESVKKAEDSFIIINEMTTMIRMENECSQMTSDSGNEEIEEIVTKIIYENKVNSIELILDREKAPESLIASEEDSENKESMGSGVEKTDDFQDVDPILNNDFRSDVRSIEEMNVKANDQDEFGNIVCVEEDDEMKNISEWRTDAISKQQVNINNENINNNHLYELKNDFQRSLSENSDISASDEEMVERTKNSDLLTHIQCNINNKNIKKDNEDQSQFINNEDTKSLRNDSSFGHSYDLCNDMDHKRSSENINEIERLITENEKDISDSRKLSNVKEPISHCNVDQIFICEGVIISDHSSIIDRSIGKEKNYNDTGEIEKSKNDQEYGNGKEADQEDFFSIDRNVNINKGKLSMCDDLEIFPQIHESNLEKTVTDNVVEPDSMNIYNSDLFDPFENESFTDPYRSKDDDSEDDKACEFDKQIAGDRDFTLPEQFLQIEHKDESIVLSDSGRDELVDLSDCFGDTFEDNVIHGMEIKVHNNGNVKSELENRFNVDEVEKEQLPYNSILSNDCDQIQTDSHVVNDLLSQSDFSVGFNQPGHEVLEVSQENLNFPCTIGMGDNSPMFSRENPNSENILKSLHVSVDDSGNHKGNNLVASVNEITLPIAMGELSNNDGIGYHSDINVSISESISPDNESSSQWETDGNESNYEGEKGYSNNSFHDRNFNPSKTNIDNEKILPPGLYINEDVDNSTSIKDTYFSKLKQSPELVHVDVGFNLTREIDDDKDVSSENIETYLHSRRPGRVDIQSDPVQLDSFNEIEDQSITKETNPSEMIDNDDEMYTQSNIHSTSLTILPRFGVRHLTEPFMRSENFGSPLTDSMDRVIADYNPREFMSLPQSYTSEKSRPLILSQMDIHLNNEQMGNMNIAYITEERPDRFADDIRIRSISEKESDPLIRNERMKTHSKSDICDQEKNNSEFSCWKIFLLAFLLAIVIISLCLPHLPLIAYCGNPVYHILQNINPFYVKRSVPV